MKKFIYLTLVFLLALGGCSKKDTPTTDTTTTDNSRNEQPTVSTSNAVKIYFFHSMPHIYIEEETKETKGALYEFLENHIAPEMGIKFDWAKEYTAIPRMIGFLQETPNTAIALLSINDERAQIMAYTAAPYYLDQACLIFRKAEPINEITKVEDFLDYSIGYAKDAFLPPFMKDERINFDLVSDPNYHSINLEKLVLGRIDALFAPGTTTLLLLINEENAKDKVKILNLPVDPSTFYVIFSKKSPELVEKYNRAFDKLKGPELYRSILAKYTGG